MSKLIRFFRILAYGIFQPLTGCRLMVLIFDVSALYDFCGHPNKTKLLSIV